MYRSTIVCIQAHTSGAARRFCRDRPAVEVAAGIVAGTAEGNTEPAGTVDIVAVVVAADIVAG